MSQTSARPTTIFGSRSVGLRLSLLQAANFAAIAVYVPFFPPWLAAQGLDGRQIGLALALAMVIRVVASPPITALGDGRIGAVRLLVALNFTGAVGYLLLPLVAGVGPLTGAVVLIAVLAAAIVPLGDHLTIAHVRARPALDYGRIRVWGSVSYLLVTLAGGALFSLHGVDTVPLALAALSILGALVAYSAPEDPSRAARPEAAPSAPAPPGQMRLLWTAVLASALINASHAPLYAFGSIYWTQAGFSPAAIGLIWATGVMAEIVVLWWTGPRAGSGVRAGLLWLTAAAAVAGLRFAIMPQVDSYGGFIALQGLHALSFGAQLIGVIIVIGALSPEGRRATVQGRVSAVNACLMGAATYACGLGFSELGRWTFAAGVPLALAALALLALAFRMARTAALDSEASAGIPVEPTGTDAAGRDARR